MSLPFKRQFANGFIRAVAQIVESYNDSCAHCGRNTEKGFPSGGDDKICGRCFTSYCRPQEQGESFDAYTTRLPFELNDDPIPEWITSEMISKAEVLLYAIQYTLARAAGRSARGEQL